ncbi:recombinase RecT [Streptomyces scabiei]|uniref:recombinase RecT n=1 Tax=Streptomyces scabiei TaxID=1930 RepID=UPI0004E779C7|nr:recombinase RecT [Streptomyces scabiei]KFG08131.1 hypothetical protein IQ61_15480 [Streptomyces scabiei]MDX3681405.1 recombinase RecT [Streptomyces scabiei]
MNEIVKHQPAAAPVLGRGGALSLSHMSPYEAWQFCESLANTPLLPDSYRNKPASVLWAMEYGRALGLDVVTTINTIHVIKGKPTQSADLMLSRAREAGHKVRIRQEPGTCTVSIWRSDDPEFENAVTWTYDDAVTAGLCEMRGGKPYSRSKQGEKQNWEKYPRAMLRARAISECVRTACPEVLHGAIYTPEEVGAWVDQDGNPVEPPMAPVQQLRPVQPGQTDQWATPGPQQSESAISPEQGYADTAGTTTNQPAIKELYRQANAAGLLAATVKVGDETQELGAYLIARGKQLAEPAPEKTAGEPSEVIEGEIVESGPEAEAAAAEQELRAAAAKAGLDNLDAEFEQSYGLPIAQAGAEQLRQMTGLLTGTAA